MICVYIASLTYRTVNMWNSLPCCRRTCWVYRY